METKHNLGQAQPSIDQIADLLHGKEKLATTEAEKATFNKIVAKTRCNHLPQVIDGTIQRLFQSAAEKMKDAEDKEVLSNLFDLVIAAQGQLVTPKPRYMDTMFFPNEDNVFKLCDYISKAKKDLRICVFNFTNNDLSKAVLNAHKRGVRVKIISDDECMKNKGNDVQFLVDNGIPARTDDAERFHMHNKFVIVDNKFLVTGSFNWTVQAGTSNQENLLVVDNEYFMQKYTEYFEDLWVEFSKNEVEIQRHRAAKTIQKGYRQHRR